MSMSDFEKCFICWKKKKPANTEDNAKLCEKFCVLVSRYLNVDHNTNISFSTASEVVEKFNSQTNGNQNLFGNVCGVCVQFINSFCENYAKWKECELRLNWSLNKVTDLMSRSKVTAKSLSKKSKLKSKPKPKCRRTKEENVSEFRRDLLVDYDIHIRKKNLPRLSLQRLKLDEKNCHPLIATSPILKSEDATSPSPVTVKMEIPDDGDFDDDSKFDPDYSPESPISEQPEWSPPPPKVTQDFSMSESKSPVKVNVNPENIEEPGGKGKSRRQFNCRHCGKGFNSRSKAFVHEFQHTGQQPFQCGICSKKFNDPYACRLHLKRVHKEKDMTKMIIENQEIARIVFPRAHRDTSTLCSYCGKEFETWKKRKIHEEASHLDTRKYQCSTCGKELFCMKNLKRHEILHTNDKPFKCKLCGRAFSDPSTCKKHEGRRHAENGSFGGKKGEGGGRKKGSNNKSQRKKKSNIKQEEEKVQLQHHDHDSEENTSAAQS